jgi:two-component system, chemotaxis family, chemotaxis protein CheY
MAHRRVLSIGQCGADHANLRLAIERHFDAEVVPAATAEEALAELRRDSFTLVLVNRIMDADGSSGVDFVKRLKGQADLGDIPVMLVSNLDDAQREAIEAGAVPGFGKAALGQPHMIGRLKPFLQTTESPGREP